MFSQSHYVPILKGKDGEFQSLANLSTIAENHITPVIEIPDVVFDYNRNQPSKTIDEHLSRIAEKLYNSWDSGRLVFIDTQYLPTITESGLHPCSYLFNDLRRRSVSAVPVISLTSDQAHLDAVSKIIQNDQRGVCLRVTLDQVGDLQTAQQLLQVCSRISALVTDVDLILDLGSLSSSVAAFATVVGFAINNSIPRIADWRTFTLSSSAFPEDLSSVSAGNVVTIPRLDWSLYQNLISKSLRRNPTYSDYAIAHPLMTDVNPLKMTISANIRYTTEREWLIFKGKVIKRYGADQYYDLSKELVTRPEYKGPDFSWGDEFIDHCAIRRAGPGNSTIWRKVGTTHHLELVAHQLASLT